MTKKQSTEQDASLSYHDLHVTTEFIPRTSIFNLPYGLSVVCSRTSGWELHEMKSGVSDSIIAGEYAEHWLVLDVAGTVIFDGRQKNDQ